MSRHYRWKALLVTAALMAGAAQAAVTSCSLAPENSFVASGQSVLLTASCQGAVTNVNWKKDNVSMTGDVAVSIPDGVAFTYTTPADVLNDSSVTSLVNYTLEASGAGNESPVTAAAKVYVGPAPLLVVNKAGGSGGMGNVTSAPGGISCGDTCNKRFLGGSSVTLHAVPASGNSFVSWSGDCVGSASSCTVTMNGNRTVTANFTAVANGQCGGASTGGAVTVAPSSNLCTSGDPSPVSSDSASQFTWTCGGTGGGSAASCSRARAYVISVEYGSNGVASPVSQNVAYGSTADIIVTPESNYSASVSGCGAAPYSGNIYRTSAVTGDCTVNVTFSNTPTNGACGSATSAQNTTAPSSNLCSTGTASSVTTNSGTYTWTCAGGNGGSTASCSATRYFLVSASAGANGSISPASRTVAYNGTTTFTVTPNSGYSASVTPSGCTGSLSGATYTTGAITQACSVSATFTQSSAPPGCPAVVYTNDPYDSNFRKLSDTISGTSLSYLGYAGPGEVQAMPFTAGSWSNAIISISDGSGYGTGDYAISTCPGDFAPSNSACSKTAVKQTNIYLYNGRTTGCILTPGAQYYLNVRPTATNTGGDGFLIKRQ